MKNISFRNDVLPLKDLLYRLALRITLNHEDAQDIVQDTLMRIWDKRDSWQEINSIEAFGMTICRNLSLDRIKRYEHQNNSLEETRTDHPDTSSNPYDQAIKSDRIMLVKQLVDALPEKQRSCMQLRDFEGKTYKEIAAVLGITEEQVKVNIFRARQTVKERFQKYDDYGL